MAMVESFHPMVAADHPRRPVGAGLQRHRRVAFVLPGDQSYHLTRHWLDQYEPATSAA
jgi:hypothetical protein